MLLAKSLRLFLVLAFCWAGFAPEILAQTNIGDATWTATGGSTTTRTASVRASEIRNVKDFGAVGNNTADDTTAIQAAITAAGNSGLATAGSSTGGVVFFPPGVYKTTAALTFSGNKTVHLIGSGRHNTGIFGSFAGYIIDKPDDGVQNLEVIQHLYIKNSDNNYNSGNTGGIRFNAAEKGIIDDVTVQGFTAISASANTNLVRISNTEITCISKDALSAGVFSGQVGIYQSRIQGCDYGVIAGNANLVISGLAIESGGTGLALGYTRAGNISSLTGFNVSGVQTERLSTGIMLGGASAGQVSGSILTGVVGPSYAVTSMTWSGSVVTVTTTVAHGKTGTFSCVIENVTPSGYNGSYTCTVTGASTFTYPLASNPGSVTVQGVWSALPQYGIRVVGATAVTFSGINLSVSAEVAGCDLNPGPNLGSGSGGTFISTVCNSWVMPQANWKSSWQYISSDNPTAAMLFADLPGQSGVIASVVEGKCFSITNSNTATYNATVAGGGSNHIRTCYNGTNWVAN